MNKKMMETVEAAKKFGYTYLGEVSFDVLKDTKKWINFLRKNKLDEQFGLIHRENGDHNDGWFLINFPNC